MRNKEFYNRSQELFADDNEEDIQAILAEVFPSNGKAAPVMSQIERLLLAERERVWRQIDEQGSRWDATLSSHLDCVDDALAQLVGEGWQ